MLGIIGFEELKISCIIGVENHERHHEQEIYVDLKIETDFSKCAISDHIHDTIDYVALAQICTEIARKGKYQLLEKYACDVVNALLIQQGINWAWIKVKKPNALPAAACSTVEMKKMRDR